MNAKHLVASLVAVLASASTFAQTPPATGITRAQVIAEIVQARADGTLPLSEASFLPYQFAVHAARAPAKAELNRPNPAGDIPPGDAHSLAAVRTSSK